MEQTNLLHEFSEPTYVPASTGQRLANYLIDLIVFYAIIFIFALVFGYSGMGSENIGTGTYYLSIFAIFFGYYTLLEGSKGRTLGKMITKTKVITETGEPMTYGKAFLRSLCRLVPFEFISVFMDTQMWHDKWTKTVVVKNA
jgi:uncharacterized RDD family membrane protein YckC